MKLNNRLALVLASSLIAASQAGGANAHHSTAMFDKTKKVTVEGVVERFEWTNPHSWLFVVVKDGGGASKVWAGEAGPPGQLGRSGWKKSSFKPGDKISVTLYPMRDGSLAGDIVSVTGSDGVVYHGAKALTYKKPS